MYSQTALETYPELLKQAEEQLKAAGVLGTIGRGIAAPFKAIGRRLSGRAPLPTTLSTGQQSLLNNLEALGPKANPRGAGTVLHGPMGPQEAAARAEVAARASAPVTSRAAPATEAAAGKPMSLTSKALLGLGAAGAAGGAYAYGRHQQAQKDKTVRNMAFGGGVAAGMAAPHLLRGVAGAANNAANSNFFGG